MSSIKKSDYSEREEKLNVLTHAFGIILSIVGLILLVKKASSLHNIMYILSLITFGASLIILYAASTLYHKSIKPRLRHKLRIFDHAAIYVLIAGTYTPFTIITLEGTTGWILFGVIWSIAIAGVILKLFFTGKYSLLSTLMYVAMGWMAVFVIGPLIDNLHYNGMFWLLAGAFFYTIGAVLFSVQRIPLNHAIFHVFVIGGSICHFLAVYWYV